MEVKTICFRDWNVGFLDCELLYLLKWYQGLILSLCHVTCLARFCGTGYWTTVINSDAHQGQTDSTNEQRRRGVRTDWGETERSCPVSDFVTQLAMAVAMLEIGVGVETGSTSRVAGNRDVHVKFQNVQKKNPLLIG